MCMVILIVLNFSEQLMGDGVRAHTGQRRHLQHPDGIEEDPPARPVPPDRIKNIFNLNEPCKAHFTKSCMFRRLAYGPV